MTRQDGQSVTSATPWREDERWPAGAAQWLAQGVPAIAVQLLATRGSTPRGAGARMLVSATATLGTIGGGQLEWQAMAEARRLLASQAPVEPLTMSLALGPTLGQCCGGAVQVLMRPLDATVLADAAPWSPMFRLQLHGAGHVGQALVPLLATLPCELHWVDERIGQLADGAQLPDTPGRPTKPSAARVQRVATDDAVAEVARMPPGSFYLVMTHSHALDFDLVRAVLDRGDAGWLGLIGSATKRARFLQRLRQRGVSEAALATLHCPIGWPELPGKTPAVIALSVAAQLAALASAQDADVQAADAAASIQGQTDARRAAPVIGNVRPAPVG